MPWYADFNQVPVAGSLVGITAASIADAITPHAGDRSFPPFLRVLVIFTGAITNADITISIGITDQNGKTGWTPGVTQEVRTLPGGGVVVGMFTFPTLQGAAINIALESAITGGGSVKLYTAFTEEH
jgi:hypothetical protein